MAISRIMVLGDTHGYTGAAEPAIRDCGPWDHVVHLGDSMADAMALAIDVGRDVVALRGNNEFPGSPDYGDKLVFEAGGACFYAVHGHELDMNAFGEDFEDKLTELARLAREAGAQVALFGHTHKALVRELGGVLVINPGGMGLGDSPRTYAEVTVEDGAVKAEIKQAD